MSHHRNMKVNKNNHNGEIYNMEAQKGEPVYTWAKGQRVGMFL